MKPRLRKRIMKKLTRDRECEPGWAGTGGALGRSTQFAPQKAILHVCPIDSQERCGLA
jgi:hypothetical protein